MSRRASTFLRAAAALLDAEAQPLVAQMGRLPEARMLLMAGLMLADKVAAHEDFLLHDCQSLQNMFMKRIE